MPARAAISRVREEASPAMTTRHAAAFARNSGPTQLTAWKITPYCWMWTPASTASSAAPAAYAAGAIEAVDGALRWVRGCASVAIAASARARARARCGDRRARRGDDEPAGAECAHALAARVAGLLVV